MGLVTFDPSNEIHLSPFLDTMKKACTIHKQVFIVSQQSFYSAMSKLCRDKGVVVAVYAEKPKGQGSSRLHLHHHHHHYHHIHQKATRGRGRGYNRRAELLDYSRHLRTPALPDASSNKQLPITEAFAGDEIRKQKHSTTPNCFHQWGFVVTRFVRSMRYLKTNKDNKGKRDHKKSLVKSLKVQKKGNLLRKLLAALHKRR